MRIGEYNIQLIDKHIKEITELDQQRIYWLRLSGFTSVILLLIIVDWSVLGQNNLYWILVCIGLTLTLCWWYWTMKLIRLILNHRIAELEMFKDIISDIKDIKNNYTDIS